MDLSHLDLLPKVSVIIPVYNGERYLAEAIESVLAQSYKSYELIIIDDGSIDSTREITLSFPGVKYIYQANRGTAAARNQGIQIAQGEFLAFLDADDLWLPDKLSKQIKSFEQDPELEIVSGNVEQFVSPEINTVTAEQYSFPKTALPGYSPIAILIKRKVFGKTGLFHEDLQVAEAVSWFATIMEKKINILILPDVVARRRIHGNNMSIIDKNEKACALIRILKRAIDRKRNKIS